MTKIHIYTDKEKLYIKNWFEFTIVFFSQLSAILVNAMVMDNVNRMSPIGLYVPVMLAGEVKGATSSKFQFDLKLKFFLSFTQLLLITQSTELSNS